MLGIVFKMLGDIGKKLLGDMGKKCFFYGFVLSIRGCWATSMTTIFMLLLFYLILFSIIKGCQTRPSRHLGTPSNIGETLGESCNIGKMLITSGNNFFMGDKGGYEDSKGQCGCRAILRGHWGTLNNVEKTMCDTNFFKGDRDAKKMPKDNGGNGKK
jgi:hypothetical protein